MAFTARGTDRPLPLPEVSDRDRFAFSERENRSHFTAFLMGGVVVASGLLAFLYYDSNGLDPNPGREPLAIGTTVQPDGLARVPSLDVVRPAAPKPPVD